MYTTYTIVRLVPKPCREKPISSDTGLTNRPKQFNTIP